MRLRFIVAPLLKWFAENARDLPWRRTRDPYAIWVSEIMLQQTQVKTVIPYWERWMNRLPDVAALANAREDTVIKLWEGLGYYSRARNMQKAARLIRDEHGGRFPRDLAGVLALPGVGRYTGGAICSIAYNQPEPIVDGNVIRVLTRVAGIEESPKAKPVLEQIWAIADDLVKQTVARQQSCQRNASAFNQAMMELGALVCTPRNPRCDVCPLKGRCVARKENKTDRIPALAKRAAATKRRYVGFAILWRGKGVRAAAAGRRGERRLLGVPQLGSGRRCRAGRLDQGQSVAWPSGAGAALCRQPLDHALPEPTRDVRNSCRPKTALGQA